MLATLEHTTKKLTQQRRALSSIIQLIQQEGYTLLQGDFTNGLDSFVCLDHKNNIIKIYKHLSRDDILRYYTLQNYIKNNKSLRPDSYTEFGRKESTYGIPVENIDILSQPVDIYTKKYGEHTYTIATMPRIQGETVKLNQQEHKAIKDVYYYALGGPTSKLAHDIFYHGKKGRELPLISYPNIKKQGNKYIVTDVDNINSFLGNVDVFIDL